MKKILSLILGLSLVFGLCACGQKADTSVPADTPTWQEQYDLGIRYLSEGNYEEAIIAFTAAIEIDPKQADAYISLAEVYTALGDTEKALSILDQAEEMVGASDLLENTRSIMMQNASSGSEAGSTSASQLNSIPAGTTLPETVRTQEIDVGGGIIQIREYDAQDHLLRATWYAEGKMTKICDYAYPNSSPYLMTNYDENGVQTSVQHRLFSEEYPSRILQETYQRSDDKLDVIYTVTFTYSGTEVIVQWQESKVAKVDFFASSESSGTAVHTMLSSENYVAPLSVSETISLAEYDPNSEYVTSLRTAKYNADGSLDYIEENL